MAGKRSANVIVIDDDAATAPYVHSNTYLIMGPFDGVPVTTNSTEIRLCVCVCVYGVYTYYVYYDMLFSLARH